MFLVWAADVNASAASPAIFGEDDDWNDLDEEEALKWISRAAVLGSAEAMYHLGKAHLTGTVSGRAMPGIMVSEGDRRRQRKRRGLA
ncbi:hypothetical protein QBK99_24815 [Corticibacterium sp. UT-5YL-CI-8]|nr:hypothetical protein [Tianweitania sp. UT-5YL-CI-8]